MEDLISEGKCYYCSKSYNSRGMNRHLTSHLKAIQKESVSTRKSYHIKVTDGGLFFLHLLVREKTELDTLDIFLRQIWLECCGHLSSFQVKGAKRSLDLASWNYDGSGIGLDMDMELGSFLRKGMKLEYEYDFGSTTRLEISVINEYSISGDDDILLLSRNEPLKLLCHSCKKKPAKFWCTIWHDDEFMFCEPCSKIHAKNCEDFDEYSKSKVVNSPRSGVCGYSGGSIDLERDGIWKK